MDREPAQQLFSTHDIAGMIQVDASTVSKWIDKGILLAFRTPGGHRRVRGSDLVAFLQQYQMPIPELFGVFAEEPAAAPAKRKARR